MDLSKNEETSRKGKALVAVTVTEQQKDHMQQYDDDSSQVGSSLDAMDHALDELSSDIRELGRCLKQTTFATSQLQKVQVKINTSIKNMLRREKKKKDKKENSILVLDKKLRKIQKNQKKIIFGYKMYKILRYVAIVAIIALIVMPIIMDLLGLFKHTSKPVPTTVPSSAVSVPSPQPKPAPAPAAVPSPSSSCSGSGGYLNCTCVRS